MKYEDIKPGVYAAKLVDWGLKEYNGQPIASLKFDVAIEGELMSLTYESFFLKKDGSENKNLKSALEVCQFTGDIENFEGKTLNNEKDYLVTVELNEYNGKNYPKITWVNDEETSKGGAKPMEKVSAAKLDPKAKMKIKAMFGSKVKNHAPQTAKVDDELGF